MSPSAAHCWPFLASCKHLLNEWGKEAANCTLHVLYEKGSAHHQRCSSGASDACVKCGTTPSHEFACRHQLALPSTANVPVFWLLIWFLLPRNMVMMICFIFITSADNLWTQKKQKKTKNPDTPDTHSSDAKVFGSSS